jgi:Protein of unknown function (DUF1761)
MELAGVDSLAILAASVAGWLFGPLWYGLLGRAWLKALGRGESEVGAEPSPLPFVVSFATGLVMAIVLAAVIGLAGVTSLGGGLVAGASCWLGFVITTMATSNALAGRRPMLTAIDGGHHLGVLLIQGAVLGALG